MSTKLVKTLCLVTTLVASHLSWAEDHVINFFASAFLPTSLTIEAGDTVTWNWIDGDHNLNSGIPGGAPGTNDEPGALFSAIIN